MRAVKVFIGDCLSNFLIAIPISLFLATLCWFFVGVVFQYPVKFLSMWRIFYLIMCAWDITVTGISTAKKYRKLKQCAERWEVPIPEAEDLIIGSGLFNKPKIWESWSKEEYLASKWASAITRDVMKHLKFKL